MSKHTPGPWSAGAVYRDFGVDVSCVECGLPKPDDGPAHICTVGNSDERMPHLANAKLIAAAPDLLEALGVLLNVFGPTAAVGREIATIHKARAAIKKATE